MDQFGSAASPNTIARDGHAAAHDTVNSSATSSRCSSAARFSASRMRCTLKVHFSITPFPRTVTSGLSCQLSGSGNAYCGGGGSAAPNQVEYRSLDGALVGE